MILLVYVVVFKPCDTHWRGDWSHGRDRAEEVPSLWDGAVEIASCGQGVRQFVAFDAGMARDLFYVNWFGSAERKPATLC